MDPILAEWLSEVTIEGLRLGGTTGTLRFHREQDGRVHGEIVCKRGPLRLVRQPPPESLTAGIGDRFKAVVEGVLGR